MLLLKYVYDELVKGVNTVRTNDASNLVKLNYKADYNKKNKEIEERIPYHDKYMVTDYFNIFASVIFAEILKLRKLGTANGFNIVEEFAIKNEVKTEKLKTFRFKLFTR